MSLEHWVWLSQVLGCGSRHLHTVLENFSDPADLYAQRGSEIIRKLGLPISVTQSISETTREDIFNIIEDCNARRIKIIPYNSPFYPECLRSISNPPPVLYATGQLDLLQKACGVAMVGTRKATEYGCKAAFSLSYRLAKAGCVPISGVADGIDKAVHLGAIAAGKATVGFLPSGHAKVRSYRKIELPNKILAAGGCLLSELPPLAEQPRLAYQLRNRLISGAAVAVVVIEAPVPSGALITAKHAIEQNKDLFAVPGRSGDSSFVGTHALIRDGATPLFEISDILGVLSDSFKLDTKEALKKTGELAAAYNRAYPKTETTTPVEHKIKTPAQNEKQEPAIKKAELPKGLSATATTVYNAFSVQGDYIDKIVEKTGLGGGQVLSALTELEIFGLVKSSAGGKYELQ